MKKLTLALSALAAVFGVSSANADVSVSGSGSVGYIAPASSGADGEVAVGQYISFGLSTTTASGMTISGGMGLTQDESANNGMGVSGGRTLTFATGGASLKIGDVEAGDTPGSVGGLIGGELDHHSDLNSNVASGFYDDDGLGFSFSTAIGSSSLNITHVGNTGADSYGAFDADGATSVTSASVTMPMGAYSITAGVASADGTTESASGISVSGAIGGGTLTVGYSLQTLDESLADTSDTYTATATNSTTVSTIATTAGTDGDLAVDGDTTVVGATYAMSLDADTSVSIGYQSVKDADSESHTQTDVVVSRALGGGASVFLEMRNLSGDAAQDGTAIAVGSRVSF
jgi:hypothetical protein